MVSEKEIFRRGSTSFFFSSLLFPRSVRKDVFDLYSFLRVADNYVDEIPKKPKQLDEITKLWEEAKSNPKFSLKRSKGDSLNSHVVKNTVRLQKKHNFETKWIDSFLNTMESDLDFKPKKTLEDSLNYCGGSAEVVGLMMYKILGLDLVDPGQMHFGVERGGREQRTEAYKKYAEGVAQRANKVQREKAQSKGGSAVFETELMHCARMLGRAFQWMNFIRDIEEDNQLGRCYFPEADIKKFRLKNLSKKTAEENPERFSEFISYQINRYEAWRDEAKTAFSHIPKRQRLPLLVATELFDWTISRIKEDPQAIYDKKIRPSRIRIVIFIFRQSFKF